MKLNLGCGSNPLPGFVNCDKIVKPWIDVTCDLVLLQPFQGKQVTEIQAHHLLCNYGFRKTDWVLKNWYELLCKKGKLVVSVPDLDYEMAAFKRSGGWHHLMVAVHGNQKDGDEDHHLSSFNESVLKEKLRNAGFRDVKLIKSNKHAGIIVEGLKW